MKILQIVVGIIHNQQHEIFITQRVVDTHMVNKPEFPGGKIEAGETPEQVLIREPQEEVRITPTQSSLFEKLEYQFPDRHITLWFWLVESWEGEPWGKEGQPTQWIAQDVLNAQDFPSANAPVTERLIAGQQRYKPDKATSHPANYGGALRLPALCFSPQT